MDISDNSMYVVKRNGEREEVSFDKILKRIKYLSGCLGCPLSELTVNPSIITQQVCSRIFNGVATRQLDELASQICASMMTDHPDYGMLASRIVVSNHHKNTSPSFSEVIHRLYQYKDCHNKHSPLISKELYQIVKENQHKLNDVIDYQRDYLIDFFGFKTLERSYLMKIDGEIVERPAHMWMRVALGIHGNDFKDAIQTYHMMSQKYFVHATPTLYNSGTPRPQMSSCFLLAMKDDSIDGIFSTCKDCAMISKWAGGIGLHLSNVRAKNTPIRGTNGISNGLVPMLRVFNNTARYVDQGGGKRNGSFAMYLEPWHPDIFEFLELRKNHGNEEERARDLFYALWIPDLFMKRVKSNGDWTLLCPDQYPGLQDLVGEEFERKYCEYESVARDKEGVKTIKAQKLWFNILESQIETGTPYLLYKDASNLKSNQQNLGTIKSSNLCTEIIEYSNAEETAVCNLASIGLGQYVTYNGSPEKVLSASRGENGSELVVYGKTGCINCVKIKELFSTLGINYRFELVDNKTQRMAYYQDWTTQCEDNGDSRIIDQMPNVVIKDSDGTETFVGGYRDCEAWNSPRFDFEQLRTISRMITKNLNKIIDRNFYPIESTYVSNKRHRPIGIGVQGLADAYAKMKYPFDSPEAAQLNKDIFETIYLGAMEESQAITEKRKSMIIRYRTIRDKHTASPDSLDESEHKEFTTLKDVLKLIPEEENDLVYTGAYSSFAGSPLSKGLFQFDLWDQTEQSSIGGEGVGKEKKALKYPEDWENLRQKVIKTGVRNSLLLAPMPTASTSQILGNNECFEPFTSNLYLRRTIAGEFIFINRYLLNDLIKLGIWTPELKDKILAEEGNIGNITDIPENLRTLYKTVWELSQKTIIDQSADRGRFVCQSQSMNLFVSQPTFNKLSSMHFYAWNKGLKTGMYYLRTKAVVKTQQFTLDPSKNKGNLSGAGAGQSGAGAGAGGTDEICESCSG